MGWRLWGGQTPCSWVCSLKMSLARNAAFHGKTVSSTPLPSITDIQFDMYSFYLQVKARLFQVSASQAQASSWQGAGFPVAPGGVLVTKAQQAEQSLTKRTGASPGAKAHPSPSLPSTLKTSAPGLKGFRARSEVCHSGILSFISFRKVKSQLLLSDGENGRQADNQRLLASCTNKMQKREPKQSGDSSHANRAEPCQIILCRLDGNQCHPSSPEVPVKTLCTFGWTWPETSIWWEYLVSRHARQPNTKVTLLILINNVTHDSPHRNCANP